MSILTLLLARRQAFFAKSEAGAAGNCRPGQAVLEDQSNETAKLPAGACHQDGGGRKVKQDRRIRSARQRRKAFEKAKDALLTTALKRWGHGDNVPPEVDASLRAKIARLREKHLGKSLQ